MLRLKLRYIGILFLFFLLGGVSYWYFNRDTDEIKIRQTLKSLCSLGSKTEGETIASTALKLQETRDLFAESCQLDFQHNLFQGTFTITEINQGIARFRMLFQQVKIEIRDLHITMISPEEAQVYFTGLLHGVELSGERISEVRDLFCKLKKSNGKWLVSDISINEVLEK